MQEMADSIVHIYCHAAKFDPDVPVGLLTEYAVS